VSTDFALPSCENQMQLLAATMEQLEDAFFVLDASQRFCFLNQKMASFYELPAEMLQGKTPFEHSAKAFLTPSIQEWFCEDFLRIVATAGEHHVDLDSLDDVGHLEYAQLTGKVFDLNGETYYLFVLRDVTQLRRLENAMPISVAEGTDAPLPVLTAHWRYDIATQEFNVTREFYQFLGMEQEEPLSQDTLLARVHPDERESVVAYVKQCYAQKTSIEYQVRLAGELERYIHVRAWLRKNTLGNDEYFGFLQDITQHKNFQNELLESDLLLQEEQRTPKIGIWNYSVQTGLFTATDEVKRFFGVPLEQEGATVNDIALQVSCDDRLFVQEHFFEAIENAEPFDMTFRKMGDAEEPTKYIYASGWPRKKTAETLEYTGFFQDITRHRQIEQKLHSSEYFLQEAQRAAKMGIWLYNPKMKRFRLSHEARQILGVQFEGAKQNETSWLTHKDIAALPSSILADSVLGDADYRDKIRRHFNSSVESKEPFEIVLYLPTTDTTAHRYIYCFGWCDENPTDDFTYVGFVQDVTEHKLLDAELQKSEDLLAEAQKIAQMGFWSYDHVKKRFRFSEASKKIFYKKPEKAPQYLAIEDMPSLFAKTDSDAAELLKKHIDEETERFDFIAHTARTNKQGRHCAVYFMGWHHFDENGHKQLLGFHQDVSQIRELVEDLEIAEDIQKSFLPTDFVEDSKSQPYEIAAILKPARYVGGDFYEVFRYNNYLWFAVADVSGKGITAALEMAVCKTAFTHTAKLGKFSPGEVLMRLHAEMYERPGRKDFVTMFCASLNLETATLAYANAGHNSPLLIPADPGKPVSEIASAGDPPLGAFPKPLFETNSFKLAPGDSILAYTDGITEAINERHEMFSVARLKMFATETRGATMQEKNQLLLDELGLFCGTSEQGDDITLLNLIYAGE